MGRFLKFIFATPNTKRDRLNLRAWFALFCLYLTAVALISLWGFDRFSETGSAQGRMVWWLGLYVFYLSLACTFVPLPTSWFVLFLASPLGPLGLALGPIERVLLVAAAGAFATAVAHVNEYHLICYLLRLGRAHRITETRIYKWAERIFTLSPFLLQVSFNMVPIPADPARWLAIIHGYPLTKFFLAHWLGRFIRYGLMALVAEVLELSVVQIVVIQVLLLIIVVLKILLQRMRQSNRAIELPEDQTA